MNLLKIVVTHIVDEIQVQEDDRDLILDFFENPDLRYLTHLNEQLISTHVIFDPVTDEVRIYKIPDPYDTLLR